MSDDDARAVSERLYQHGFGRNSQPMDDGAIRDGEEHGDQEHRDQETLGADRPLFPSPTAPLDVARKLYAQYRIGGNGLRTLVSWRSGWMSWETTHWSELDTAHLRSDIYDVLGEVDYKQPIREKGITVDYEIRRWSPDKHKVANVIEAMAAIGHLSTAIDPPHHTTPT